MWRDILFIARADLRAELRQRATLIWLFVMPIVFFYFIGTVTGGRGQVALSAVPLTLSAGPDAGPLAGRLARLLEQRGFDLQAASAPDAGARRVTVPERFTARVTSGEQVVLEYAGGGAGPASEYDRVRAARAAYTLLGDVAILEASGAGLDEAGFAWLDGLPRQLTLTVGPAGERREIPSGFEQAVPGMTVMFTMLVLLTGGAARLVEERDTGVLRRLATTPITRGRIVLGKWGGRMALGTVQLAFGLLAGSVLFGMDWGPDIALVFVVMLAWGAFCASLALLLGSIARTQGQVAGLGVMTSMMLAALGGCWWPIEITPAWMQTLASLIPSGWAMAALHALVSFHAGVTSALGHVVALLLGAAVVGRVAAARFRFE